MKSEEAEIVKRLKIHFDADIDSIRTSEKIVTFHDLIQVLHDRDVLEAILGSEYDIESLSIEEFLDAVEGTAQIHDKAPIIHHPGRHLEISSVIGSNWRELAPLLNISVESCLENNSGKPEEKLLRLFRVNCGKVCTKEVRFRLLRALHKSNRSDLVDAILAQI